MSKYKTNNKPQVVKATWDDYEWLSTDMYNNKLSADKVVEWFKTVNYIVGNKHYEATRVSAMVRGMELASAQSASVVESLVDAVALVNDNISKGALKYTKAKMVHSVPKTV